MLPRVFALALQEPHGLIATIQLARRLEGQGDMRSFGELSEQRQLCTKLARFSDVGLSLSDEECVLSIMRLVVALIKCGGYGTETKAASLLQPVIIMVLEVFRARNKLMQSPVGISILQTALELVELLFEHRINLRLSVCCNLCCMCVVSLYVAMCVASVLQCVLHVCCNVCYVYGAPMLHHTHVACLFACIHYHIH